MKPRGGADYGSENSEETAFVRRATPLQAQRKPKGKKNMLAAVGVSLCVGGAMLAYGMSSSASSGELLASDVLSMNADTMTLESQQVYDVPPILQGGREFLLQIRGKNNLCMDDGGGTKAGTTVTMVTCNPDNMNQVFTYDTKTYQIRSAGKPNLCYDDAGINSSGARRSVLWDCDPNNQNQRFVYDAKTQMFRNPTKANLCIDDGGGTTLSGSQFTVWGCDNNNPNQHFEVKFRDDLLAEKQRVIDAVMGGAKFVLRVQSKNNLCVDDGGGWKSGATQFHLMTCDFENMNQVWVWDPVIKRIRSYKKPGMCVDDGGGSAAGSSKFSLWECDVNNVNQNWVIDRTVQMFRNPAKSHLCMDDGSSWSSASGIKTQLWTCDVYNANQHFEYVLVPPLPEYAVPPVLQSGREFLLQIRGKNDLCMDDGGGLKNGATKTTMMACNPDNTNQLYVYDTKTYQIRSARKPNLCVDDAGSNSAGVVRSVMWECDVDSKNQRFVYDAKTQMFRNPTKANLCIDDGGGTTQVGSQFTVFTCDNNNPNQHFEVKFRDDLLAEKQRVIDAVMGGAKFVLRVQSKNNLCVDDGGGWKSGATQFHLMTCDFENMNQVWVWDPVIKRIRSYKKPGMCVDDGGGSAAGSSKFSLWECDVNNVNQNWVIDRTVQMFRNPAKSHLCMDDGSSWSSASGIKTQLWTCDVYNANQHFEYVLVPPLPEYAVPPVLQSGREFLLQIRGKNDLCMDDGGGLKNGATKTTMMACNPDNTNQLYVYDTKTYQIRSARKPNLCVDDAGSNSAGVVRSVMWECDVDSKNQRFVYDAKTQMFRNPTKANLCIDDGGGTTQVGSQFTVFTCDNNNPNQHFEVKFRDDLLAEKQRVIDAVMGGAKFVLRVQSKNNLCVDDGGGWKSGATQFHLMTCDFENMNQVWVWDPVIKRIRSYKKPGMCVDDGGGSAAGSSKFSLWECDVNNVNQNWVIDRTVQMFRNPAKSHLCMDDGSSWSSASGIKTQLWTCDVYNANQHFEYVLVPPLPEYAVPPVLQSGREFLLQIRGKNDLCMDDGGGVKADETKLIIQSCNPSNPNQAFVYDMKTYQIRSASKPRLCVDDGGTSRSGGSKMTMMECDADSRHQRFVYDRATEMFRNPTKGDICIDDGAGVKSGSTQFWLWTCENNSPNQHFEVKFRDEWLAEQQRVIDAVSSGAKFLLRAQSKDNLCVDDGGATAAGTERMQLVTCDVENMSQVFVWDAATKRIQSFKKKGLCVDDGGGATAGRTKMWLWTCEANNRNQDFVLDKTTLQFRQESKPKLCMDDGNSWRSATEKMQLWTCDAYNNNQHFEYVLVPPLPVYDVAPEIKTDREFLLKIRGKNSLCVDDGGGVKKGETKFLAQPCNPSNVNQAFFYDWKTYQIRSARDPSLCMDDGGATNPAGSNVILWECDVDNRNQRFLYDPVTQQFRNPTKENLCLDDGGGTAPGQTRFVLFTCNDANPNQHFEIKFRDEWQAEQQRVIDEVASGAKFVLRVPGKDNLCVDDGGGDIAGSSKMQLSQCDTSSVNQIFVWDTSIRRIRSSNKNGLCIDDGGGWVLGLLKFQLWHCDAKNANQEFVFDKSTLLFRNPNKPNLCMDDGGGVVAGQTKIHYFSCDVYNPSQHFEYVLVPPLPVYDVAPEIKTDREFLLKIRGKNSLCVDDGGGVKKGETKFLAQPCNPSNVNQAFFYDWKTYQIRSARNPSLCVDDGGAMNPAGSNVILWDCAVDNRNQRFLYDPVTQQFRNPTKENLCLDDGGGTAPGQTRFVLFTCNDANPNQHFEIKFRDEWQAEQQRVIDEAASGAKFVLRVPGKDNLCVDDGGADAAGSAKMQLSHCSTSNANQIFVWDSAIRRIRSVAKSGLCMDDGGGWVLGLLKFQLWHCDAKNANQEFVFDKSTLLFRNPNKPNLCMDDGGGVVAGQTKIHYFGCDVYNPNQHFEYVLVPVPATLPPSTDAPTTTPAVTPAPGQTDLTPTVTTAGPPPSQTDARKTDDTPEPMPTEPPTPTDTITPSPTEPEPTLPPTPTDTMTPSTTEPEPTLPPTPTDTMTPSPTEPEPTTVAVPTSETPIQPIGFPDVNDEPTDEPTTKSASPSTAPPKYEDKLFNESDWNLLAPSHDTITRVNADHSAEITADEIYAFLSEIKHQAEHKFNVVSFKYDATLQCVTAGLHEFQKEHVSTTEYHALVKWMYEHCAVTKPVTKQPIQNNSTDGPVVHTYMTKLEFYYQIRDHFLNERAETFGKAEAARLRANIASIGRAKLMACVDEAANRFGAYKEYELPEHFHKAIQWVQHECVHA